MDTPISDPGPLHLAPAAGDVVPPPVVPDSVPVVTTSPGSAPLSLILGGFLALLLSAWAGIVPFVGPSFGFSADGTASWTWNLVHGLGAVVPGAVGLLACLGIVVIARRLTGTLDSRRLVSAGFLTFLCGAWFASVPVVWPVLVGSYFHAASPSLTLDYWMGLAIGPGVLLAAFGAFAMGRAGRESHEKS
ncbi:MAG: hypothetical protein WAV54_12745 [Acidimicrobiales bacterium]|jgi:hypothetical protein